MKRKIKNFTLTAMLFSGIIVFNWACEGPDGTIPEEIIPIATSIDLVSGNEQSAEIEKVLANPIEIIVKDQNGNAFQGTAINFSVTEGSVTFTKRTTDADGKASVTWTLGSTEGSQTLTVTAFKTDGTTALTGSPITVAATASPVPLVAASIELVSGNNQIADIDKVLENPVEVIVKDQNGNAFQGTTVNFSVTEGSVSSETITSDANGKASVAWTLGSTLGKQTLTITAFNSDGTTALTGSPITVNATAISPLEAASIELVSVDGQTAEIEKELSNPVEIIVKDQNGDAFQGATIHFSVTEGSVSSTTGSSDVEGKASVIWTLGSTVGTQVLTITAFKSDGTTVLTGAPIAVNASATAPLEATSIELVSGDNQTAEAYKALENPVEVIVKDQNGDAFQGITVNFSVSEGSVSSESGISDVNGKASITWTLGPTIGAQTLTVTAFKPDGTTPLSGSPIEINVTATTPTLMDVDGNIYPIVIIGEQVWMAENLKVTHYDNSGIQGDAIPLVTDNTAWDNLGNNNSDKAYCYYANSSENAEIYGALYTWAAAMNGSSYSTSHPSGVQGVCPTGWHLPSDDEWIELTSFVGGADVGNKLKEEGITHWEETLFNLGTNESGFTGLPGGFRSPAEGQFLSLHAGGSMWSATQRDNSVSYALRLFYGSSGVSRREYAKSAGVSVRCLRD